MSTLLSTRRWQNGRRRHHSCGLAYQGKEARKRVQVMPSSGRLLTMKMGDNILYRGRRVVQARSANATPGGCFVYEARVYRVMIATPGDVPSERQIVRDAVHYWNEILADKRGGRAAPCRLGHTRTPHHGRATTGRHQ